ncbi:hypothetical protein V2O64_16740 [Verrucomicrobiaceae bacterium 227]
MKRLLTSLTSLTLLFPAAHAQEREQQRDRPAAQRTADWDQIKKRIEAAVERGDLTRDQANAKYTGIKKNLALRKSLQNNQKHDREARLRQLLGRLVESKQISREVAVQIHQLAFEGHDQGPGPKQQEHLGKLAGELERLIDRAHHELKAIEETRHRLNGDRRERGQNEERRAHEQEARERAEKEKSKEKEQRGKDKKHGKEEHHEKEKKDHD